jgi:hypothetical protein
MNILEDTIRLQLTEGSQWLNSYLSLKDVDENKKIPLEVAPTPFRPPLVTTNRMATVTSSV